jgi:hypothetical protein
LPAIGVAGLAVIAGSYIVALADAVAGSPLIGIAYVSIIVGCLTSMTMIAHGNTAGWLLSAAISAAAIAGYIAKHHNPVQGLADTETTFIAGRVAATSLSAEGVVIVVATIALLRQRGATPPDVKAQDGDDPVEESARSPHPRQRHHQR